MSGVDLRIEYHSHDGVEELADRIMYSLEGITLGFEKWDEQFVKGPGLYIAIITGPSVEEFADPVGRNEWPVNHVSERV